MFKRKIVDFVIYVGMRLVIVFFREIILTHGKFVISENFGFVNRE